MGVTPEQAHMEAVAQLPCCLCGDYGVHVHHILEGRIKGRKCSGFCTIPLCPDCHEGSVNGIHGQQVMLKVMKTTELELLGQTIEKLYGHRRHPKHLSDTQLAQLWRRVLRTPPGEAGGVSYFRAIYNAIMEAIR